MLGFGGRAVSHGECRSCRGAPTLPINPSSTWHAQSLIEKFLKPRRESDLKRTVHDKWKAVAVLLLSIVLTACMTGPSASRSKDRLAKAQAMFAQRCQAAGEKIYRTVDNVEGVFLLKLRPVDTNYSDQFLLNDPYGRDSGGQGYIKTFIRGSYLIENKPAQPNEGPSRVGYRYVEVADPEDGQIYRYTGRIEEPWQENKSYLKGYMRLVLEKVLAEERQSRYGVTYDDISTREERENWIAASSLKVIDLKTNELMAERVGYMIDLAQGSSAGGRAPWLFAANNACPAFGREFKRESIRSGHAFTLQLRQTQDFVEKVLKPKK